MASTADLLPDDVRRLPGLYRRWELTEVFEAHRNYQIEDAGTHADGTPLLAIYVSDPVPALSKILPTRSLPQASRSRSRGACGARTARRISPTLAITRAEPVAAAATLLFVQPLAVAA